MPKAIAAIFMTPIKSLLIGVMNIAAIAFDVVPANAYS
jgi:hypothetical protein